jgi:hypothetical protein
MLLAKELAVIAHLFQRVTVISAKGYINCGILGDQVYGNWNDNVWRSLGFVMRRNEFIDSSVVSRIRLASEPLLK